MTWEGPPQSQDFRGREADGIRRLLGQVKDAKRTAVDAARSLLRTAGIGVTEDGLTINSSLYVVGDIWTNYAGSAENPGRINSYVSGSTGRAVTRITPPHTGTLDDTALYLEGPSGAQPNGYVILTSGGQTVVDGQGDAFLISRAAATVVEAATSLYLNGGDDVNVDAGDNANLTAGGWVFLTGDGGFAFRKTGPSSTWVVEVFSSGDGLAMRGTDGFTLRSGPASTDISSAPHALYTVGDDQVYRAPVRHYFSGNIYSTGSMSCAGTKPFTIDHPLREDKSLVHVAVEAPVAELAYPWPGPVTLDDQGQAELELPDYFEALCADDYRAVWVQPVGRPFPTGADLVIDGKTTVYGEPGRQVFVRVTARRGDAAGQFDVEIPRVTYPEEA